MNSQEPFKREYGFCYIVTPEDKAKYSPKLETDEYWSNMNQSWHGVGFGSDFTTINHYRRKISPGEGFEIVPEDGLLSPEPGMWSTDDGIEWIPSTWSSRITAGQAYEICRNDKNRSQIIAFRRPITKPVESGWVSVKERLPEKLMPFYATDGVQVVPYPNGLGDVTLLRPHWLHWMDWKMPTPPQPPRPAAEVAYEEWSSAMFAKCRGAAADCWYYNDGERKHGWLAGIEWAKSHLSELSKEGK